VSRIDEYAIVITVLGWVDQRSSDFGKVKSETIRLVKEAFDARHIELAEPVQNYRELRAPRPEPASTAAAYQPTAEELRQITDTSRDRTIENKVAEQRAEADDDLLAPVQRG